MGMDVCLRVEGRRGPLCWRPLLVVLYLKYGRLSERYCFEEYLKCSANCRQEDCLNSKICENPFIPIWKLILDHTAKAELINNEEKLWDWYGIIYHPSQCRNKHQRFLSVDPFFI